ncbi:hypothetical protein CLCR_09380 [Cladophialophora carrionii]|uniref:Uncharacterized protein n=1 Tax=Cladophialophora carrionii TaxID=86049 RepID=A0A1C1CRL4_9EURO|nr:hypothetical protein CLCR_09380 [Cladophialophora carrionii]
MSGGSGGGGGGGGIGSDSNDNGDGTGDRTDNDETIALTLRRVYHENPYFKYRAARMGLQNHRKRNMRKDTEL